MPTINHEWWESLSPQWQQAFSLCVFQKADTPTAADLETLANLTVLRIAGPTAPHPNFNSTLQDLSGVEALVNLQILIVSHHEIRSVQELAHHHALKSLFLNNNLIERLAGIEGLTQLEQLYVNSNELVTVTEIEGLTNLAELNIADNRLTSLRGLSEAHADKLKKFYCKPNEQLKHKEIIYVERELGIICR